jgi:hypothetical protein
MDPWEALRDALLAALGDERFVGFAGTGASVVLIARALRGLRNTAERRQGRRPTDAEIDELLNHARRVPELAAAVERIDRDQRLIRERVDEIMAEAWRADG